MNDRTPSTGMGDATGATGLGGRGTPDGAPSLATIVLLGALLLTLTLGAIAGLKQAWTHVVEAGAARNEARALLAGRSPGTPSGLAPAAGSPLGSEAGQDDAGGTPSTDVATGQPGVAATEARVESALLAAVTLAALLGGLIHVLTSFTWYVGSREFKVWWIPYYLAQPVVGMALGLVVFFVVRAGFWQDGQSEKPIALVALAGLTGMFGRNVTEKLKALTETLFGAAPAKGKDPLSTGAEQGPEATAAGSSAQAERGADGASNVDGCDVAVTQATADAELPAAKGGVG